MKGSFVKKGLLTTSIFQSGSQSNVMFTNNKVLWENKVFLTIRFSQNEVRVLMITLSKYETRYYYLSKNWTCPLIFFENKIHPTLCFSCHRLKIPSYPPVLCVGWIFHPTHLSKPTRLLEFVRVLISK